MSWLLASAFLLLAIRLALFVNRYAVNILYWDQWDFLQGLFDGADAWSLFRWQHGPQRQGLGNLILALVYSATDWNGRADAAASAAAMLLAGAAALWLVKRVAGSLRPWDIVVPLLFLTTANAENYVAASNLSHGPLPALLLMLYALALTIPSHGARCAALVIVNFFCVNTGFTLLLGVVTPGLLLVLAAGPHLAVRERAVYAAGLAASLATNALFLHGFVPLSAVDCFQFPAARPWEYLPFAGFILVRPLGMDASAGMDRLLIASGSALAMAVFVAYAVWHFIRSRGESVVWGAAATLAGFSFLFASTTAVGRVCLGFEMANASRYVPYVLPGLLAIYLVIRTSAERSRLSRLLLPVLLLGCVLTETSRVRTATAEAEAYFTFKSRWRNCYLANHDILICDSFAGRAVYPPHQAEATHLQQKLDFLETRGFSLFLDYERPSSTR